MGRSMLNLSDETQAEIAVDRLTSDILSGSLSPGRKLRVAELKALYGLGASPLREALSRVVSLGYVTSETRRGYRVAEMSQQDLADITRVRQLIETQMLRESMAARQDEWELGVIGALERMRLVLRKKNLDAGFGDDLVGAAHKKLHTAIVSGCTSPRLIAMQDLLFDQASRYREMMISEVSSPMAFLQKHENLIDKVLGDDVEGAIVALLGHLNLTLSDVYGGIAGDR